MAIVLGVLAAVAWGLLCFLGWDATLNSLQRGPLIPVFLAVSASAILAGVAGALLIFEAVSRLS